MNCCFFFVRYRITSPLILIVIGCLMYANYRIRQLQEPVLLFGKLFSVNQLCIALSISGVPILYLFGAGNIVFWVVGKTNFMSTKLNSVELIEIYFISLKGASTLVVALHATFYNIDAIVTEEFEAFLAESETV